MEDLERIIEDLIAKRKQTQTKVEQTDVSQKNAFNIDFDKNASSSNNQELISFKQSIIRHLEAAKISHKKWMSYVQILLRLGDVEEAKSAIPINYTLCDFGQWYYGEGRILKAFPEFIQMEEVHMHVHDTYLQIYNLYNKKIKGHLFNSEKSQLEKRNKKAAALSDILNEYSKIMFDLLLIVEQSVKKMSYDDLEKIQK